MPLSFQYILIIFTRFYAKLRQMNNTIIGRKQSNIYSSKNTGNFWKIKTQLQTEAQTEGFYHLLKTELFKCSLTIYTVIINYEVATINL